MASRSVVETKIHEAQIYVDQAERIIEIYNTDSTKSICELECYKARALELLAIARRIILENAKK